VLDMWCCCCCCLCLFFRLQDIDAGKLWPGKPAPAFARAYWRLPEDATMRDLILVVSGWPREGLAEGVGGAGERVCGGGGGGGGGGGRGGGGGGAGGAAGAEGDSQHVALACQLPWWLRSVDQDVLA
jgi:hypothetical protein